MLFSLGRNSSSRVFSQTLIYERVYGCDKLLCASHQGGFMIRNMGFLALLALSGCAAKQVIPEAASIEIVIERPNSENCKFLGEIVGSQGNWVTGDFTSNKNLVVGARNELRNRAYTLGGNIVYLQDMKNTNAYGSTGTTNTTAVGKVYKCSK